MNAETLSGVVERAHQLYIFASMAATAYRDGQEVRARYHLGQAAAVVRQLDDRFIELELLEGRGR